MRFFLVASGGYSDTHVENTFGMYTATAVQETARRNVKLRILLSYHYYKNVDLDELFTRYFTEPYPDVFADSGGFSAMTQGAVIDLDEYATWINRWQHLLTVYANLDVIGDAGATAVNQSRLEDKGLAPIPVFHTGEDWSYLERYIDQYPYIALGGMVPYMRFPKKIMPWIIKAFKIARDEQGQARSVYHGFGATAWKVVRDLPWYSVDSSSWGQGFRFGQVPLFDPSLGGFVKANLGDRASCYRYENLFRSSGFDPEDFADRARNDRAKICAISALSYMKAEQWLRQRHGEIQIPGRETAGCRLHLADTSNGVNLGDADAGLKLHLCDTDKTNLSMDSAGLKLHLADSRGDRGGDLSAAENGLKVHLADTTPPSSWDTGRIQEGLNEGNRNR